MPDTILFRQKFPPPHHDAGASWFGGLPLVPSDFVWPRERLADGRERPLTFILQLDCAATPRGHGLPERGLLQFFLDLDWGAGDGFRVLHQEAAPESLRPASPPGDAAAPYGEEARHVFPWLLREGAEGAGLFVLPKWPFDPVALHIPDEMMIEDGEAMPYWPSNERLKAQLAAAQGVPPPHVSWKSESEPVPPFEQMPQDWRAVEWLAGEVLSRLRCRSSSEIRAAMEAAPPPPPPAVKKGWLGSLFAPAPEEPFGEAARARWLADQRAGAEDWLRRAAAYDPFAPLTDRERMEFRDWLAARPMLRGYELTGAALKAMESSLAASPQAAARVPREALRALAERHAFAVGMGDDIFVRTPVRMFGPPSCVQTAAGEMMEEGDYRLLLELEGDEGLAHFFGEGVYQFWITQDDLAARRFDRVRMTRDAY